MATTQFTYTGPSSSASNTPKYLRINPMFRELGRETRRSRPVLIERPVDLSFYGRSCDQLKCYGIGIWNQIILRRHWSRSRLVGGVLCVPGVA